MLNLGGLFKLTRCLLLVVIDINRKKGLVVGFGKVAAIVVVLTQDRWFGANFWFGSCSGRSMAMDQEAQVLGQARVRNFTGLPILLVQGRMHI